MYLSKLKRIYVRKGWELMQNNGVIQKKFMWTVKGPNRFWTKANENCYLLHNQSTQSVQRYFDHFQFQSPVYSWYLKKNSWNDKSLEMNLRSYFTKKQLRSPEKIIWTVKGPNKFWIKAYENCYLPHNQFKGISFTFSFSRR